MVNGPLLGVRKANAGWRCDPCRCNIPSEEALIPHCQSVNHLNQIFTRARAETVLELAAMAERNALVITRLRESATASSRASELFPAWQDCVLAHLFRYVNVDLAAVSATDARLHLTQANTLLEKYEHLERFALLDLAVWKAQCTARAGEQAIGPNVKTVDDAIRFAKRQRDSWKEYRTEMSNSNAMGIVLGLVRPFVGE